MKRSALLVALSVLVSAQLFAQSQFKYVAKFVCGKADEDQIKSFATSPGLYYTSINVTNQNLQTAVRGRKRFSIGQLRQRPGPVSAFDSWALKPGETMQIDCSDIAKHLDFSLGFVEGFVFIVGEPARFEVTAVYTVSDGERPVSIDVEPLTPVGR